MAEPINPMQVLEEMGLDDNLGWYALEDNEEVELKLEDGRFYAKGPGILYIGFIPKEAFDG
jgi:hypothetical protein